jgi:hypothetical protein
MVVVASLVNVQFSALSGHFVHTKLFKEYPDLQEV